MIRALLSALRAVIGTMEIVILARVICELKGVKRDIAPFRFLLSISEPLLEPVRKLLKQDDQKKLPFDISPFFVMIILYVFYNLLKKQIL